MALFNRSDDAGRTATAPTADDLDAGRLRDESDPDELVEQATDRLRQALTSLDARDEWNRPLAWRQVARIALGPVLTELRDAQTAARLHAATARPPVPDAAVPTEPLDDAGHAGDLFATPLLPGPGVAFPQPPAARLDEVETRGPWD